MRSCLGDADLQETTVQVCQLLLTQDAFDTHGQIIVDSIAKGMPENNSFLSDEDQNPMAELLLSTADKTHKAGMAVLGKFGKFFQPGSLLTFVKTFGGEITSWPWREFEGTSACSLRLVVTLWLANSVGWPSTDPGDDDISADCSCSRYAYLKTVMLLFKIYMFQDSVSPHDMHCATNALSSACMMVAVYHH